MIISIPTSDGAISFCVNAPLLKLLALVAVILMAGAGYCVAQLASFILSCTPEQFIRIVIVTILIASPVVARALLKKAGTK